MRRGGRDQQTASQASRADPGDARHAESKLARVQSHVATPRHKRTHRPARRPSWAHATGKRTMFLPLRSSQDSSYSTISPSRSALPSLIDDTWQNKSSPPSAGLMKPNPRGFQRHASPLSRFLPPPPPRPRLRERLRLFLRSRERLRLLRPPERLRERPPPPPPPPPRLRLRERLFLQRRGPVSPCDGPAGEVCGETWHGMPWRTHHNITVVRYAHLSSAFGASPSAASSRFVVSSSRSDIAPFARATEARVQSLLHRKKKLLAGFEGWEGRRER